MRQFAYPGATWARERGIVFLVAKLDLGMELWPKFGLGELIAYGALD